MKTIKFIFAAAFVLFAFLSFEAQAANTVTRTGNVIYITDIDSDWSWSDTFPNYGKILVKSIQFNGAQADDQCVIKEATDSGAPLFDVTVEDAYDQRFKPFGVLLRPVLDYSAGTYTAGSKVIIILDF